MGRSGGLAAVTALVALCMLYLKGGGDSEMTALWIAAIVVFGVVEAVTAGWSPSGSCPAPWRV